ncbi:hypothetical protein BV20DRAFT_974406 [Pilatotrama ljubarskyi]|nr:hypothetical protein BV20DRAFT_974406 [Pilatotrama ljubarskyi]
MNHARRPQAASRVKHLAWAQGRHPIRSANRHHDSGRGGPEHRDDLARACKGVVSPISAALHSLAGGECTVDPQILGCRAELAERVRVLCSVETIASAVACGSARAAWARGRLLLSRTRILSGAPTFECQSRFARYGEHLCASAHKALSSIDGDLRSDRGLAR